MLFFHLDLLIITHVDPHHLALNRFGRRVVLMGAIVSQAVFGVAIAFAPDIYSFHVLRFAVGMAVTGVSQVTFVLGTVKFVDQNITQCFQFHFAFFKDT